jgi:hypothetical protein
LKGTKKPRCWLKIRKNRSNYRRHFFLTAPKIFRKKKPLRIANFKSDLFYFKYYQIIFNTKNIIFNKETIREKTLTGIC